MGISYWLDSRRTSIGCASVFFKACLLLQLGLVPAWGQVATPDTPAGRTLAAMLEAFNSGDRERIESYIQTHRHPQTLENMVAFRGRTGGLDLLSIENSGRLSVEYMVKERGSETRAIGRLQVEDTEPVRVTRSNLSAIPPGASVVGFEIDAATRARVIEGAAEKLNELYVFPEIAAEMGESLASRQKRGEYDSMSDGAEFASLLTDPLREVNNDLHLRVNFVPFRMPDRPSGPNPAAAAQYRRQMERINCGFEKVERLSSNVGYLKFNMFANPDVCGATASAAMNFLANVDAIIIDLRQNGGGDPKMVAFVSSYLFAEPTHLNDLWTRSTDTTRQHWTLPYVPGKRLGDEPVYVLTSRRTFSGAEEFSYNLKSLGRATIVGETTGGGAHPVRGVRIDDRFLIGVPFARAINPITKTNWEGTGVDPDVKVPAEEALSRAQNLAAEKLGPQ